MWRMFLLAGASVAALAGTAAEAVTFTYTGGVGVQTYLVTQTGIYTLTAAGAQGGRSDGGLGAYVSGRLLLTSGTTLNVVVGAKGRNGPRFGAGSGGGGGGGSFIYLDLATPFAVAGGGGGGFNAAPGGPGLAGINGGTTNSGGDILGGTDGSGGDGGETSVGGGGGGFLSDGGYKGGGGGGGPSGFSGAISSDPTRTGGFGGGGRGNDSGGGGGGGSFLAASATNTVLTAGINSGKGSASIDLFRAIGGVPEPSSWAMLITGFGGIGAMLRRRRLRTA